MTKNNGWAEVQDVIKSQRTKDIQEFFDPNRFDN